MSSAPASRSAGRPCVLLVDDDPDLCRLIALTLDELDCEVQVIADGSAAVSECVARLPDLVLLDCQLPGTPGLEVCRQLKRDDLSRGIPVMFITAGSDPELEEQCWDAGAVDFVAKSVHPRTLLNRVRAHLTLKAQADQLRELAYKDALTGVANRRYFHDRIEAELGRARRLGTPLSLLMIDVDHFKAYNDHYGHLAGDQCLASVAGALKQAVHRPTDAVARIGGEEFGCLLPDTALGNACTVAERMRAAVLALALPHAPSPSAEVVSISIGVAEIDLGGGQKVRAWLAEADARLYRAKQAGRNRVCASTE